MKKAKLPKKIRQHPTVRTRMSKGKTEVRNKPGKTGSLPTHTKIY